MTFVIDIDDTLMTSDITWCECGNYTRINGVKPIKNEIALCNKMYEAGHTIILHTGRKWNHYDITKQQLQDCGIKYHELIMGKPLSIYIDRDSLKSIAEWKA